MEIDAREICPPIVMELFTDFHQFPTGWTAPVGDFIIDGRRTILNVLQPGELVYDGTLLHSLKIAYPDEANANFAIRTQFYGKEDLIIEIRGRRSSSVDYVCFRINFETNIIDLREVVAGVPTILTSVSHTMKHETNTYYHMQFIMKDDLIAGGINNDIVITSTSSHNITEAGFSIYIPQFLEGEEPSLQVIGVHETADPIPQELDSNDMLVVARLRAMEKINSPTEKTWANFKEAFNYWNAYGKDPWWDFLGYPLQDPPSERWFSD